MPIGRPVKSVASWRARRSGSAPRLTPPEAASYGAPMPNDTPDLIDAPAVALANGQLGSLHGKTTHGLIRGPSRFEIVAVVDPDHAGQDAGEVIDGRARGIPVVATIHQALAIDPKPQVCVIGLATKGGVLPDDVRADVMAAAQAGLTIVNGLHRYLADDPQIAVAAQAGGARLVDFRRTKPASELAFWTGDVLDLKVPRVAVLGTDCAVGKRTTAGFVREAMAARGLRAEVVFTGQTGYLQGYRHGFFFDATPNDFVSGELERAILACARETKPNLMLIEGQASLRNPSGPAGSELLLSAALSGVVLQIVPGRTYFEGLEDLALAIPSTASEIRLIQAYGVPVLAMAINDEGLSEAEARATADELENAHSIPVVLPLRDGVDRIADTLCARLGLPVAATHEPPGSPR